MRQWAQFVRPERDPLDQLPQVVERLHGPVRRSRRAAPRSVRPSVVGSGRDGGARVRRRRRAYPTTSLTPSPPPTSEEPEWLNPTRRRQSVVVTVPSRDGGCRRPVLRRVVRLAAGWTRRDSLQQLRVKMVQLHHQQGQAVSSWFSADRGASPAALGSDSSGYRMVGERLDRASWMLTTTTRSDDSSCM